MSHQNSKLKPFRKFNEELDKPYVFTFGRFNPPTRGHGKVFEKVASLASGNKYGIFVSQTQDAKKNPLTYDQKYTHLKAMFPQYGRNFVHDTSLKTIIEILNYIYKEGHSNIIMVVGEDRVEAFEKIIGSYNGDMKVRTPFEFASFSVVSAGIRDPDNDEDVSSFSGTKMRDYAKKGDVASFVACLPSNFSAGKKLFNDVRKGLGLDSLNEARKHTEMPTLCEAREAYVKGNAFRIYESFIDRNNSAYHIVYDRSTNFVLDERGNKHFIENIIEAVAPATNDGFYSCVMADVSSCDEINKYISGIDVDILYYDADGGKGAEHWPHVTLLYGLANNTFDEVKHAIGKVKKFDITLGKISLFTSNEKYDVLKIDVSSTELYFLNKTLKTIDHKREFQEYIPHITLAYVEKGSANDLVGDDTFVGKKISVSRMIYSDMNQNHTVIKESQEKS